MTDLWRNWTGNQRALVEVVKPTTEHELCELVAHAARTGTRIKAVGAGHSFSDCALTDGTLVDLSDYGRILSLDVDQRTLTVQAGARLGDLSEYLFTRGWAFENLGDIDRQSLAGAVSTGTHGTGIGFGGLAAGITALRVIDGSGTQRTFDSLADPDGLSVARVGLGALGLISTITISVVPAFHLHAVEQPRRIEAVIESFDDDVAANDHYEFFYVPHTPWALTKTNRRNVEPLRPLTAMQRWRSKELRENVLFGAANRLGNIWPSLVPRLAQEVPKAPRVEYNEPAHRVFASPRNVRFTEMEYGVPLEATMEALGEIRSWIDRTGNPTMFPIEVRACAADDIALSMATGRDTGYIAVHCYRDTPNERYFEAAESILRSFDGRPHWGKLHRVDSSSLASLYPRWDQFQELRDELDPQGVFENSFTNRCLGRRAAPTRPVPTPERPADPPR